HIKQSLKFASMAQDRLVRTAGRVDKEVRQAGFWVLWATSMPSVLVELDFICNPAQEKFLASTTGQDKCAQALFEAFRDYYGK
ncbi:MAG: N-acetylmuramoyl-L-alanine amidase, partial [Lachnospiraceae bacterium]|nr:N-acetylmuramoyl-L-alanine amidase [Lachnospiraceae bacterium]